MKNDRKRHLNKLLDEIQENLDIIGDSVNQETKLYGYCISDKMIIEIQGITDDYHQFIACISGRTQSMSRYSLSDVCFTVDQYEKILSNIPAVAMYTSWERKEISDNPYGELNPIFCIPRKT